MELWIVLAAAAATMLVAALVWHELARTGFDADEAVDDTPNSSADAPAYRYYALGNEFFRTRYDDDGAPDILRNGRWVRFQGDPLEPVSLGKHINPDGLPGRAGELAQLLDARRAVKRQLEVLRTVHVTGYAPAPNFEPGKDELKSLLSSLEKRISELQS